MKWFTNEVKVALLVIVSIAIFYFGFRFLKGIDFLSQTKTFYVVYDRIGGLQIANKVTINDLPVGRVSNITLMQRQNHRILVTFDVDKDIVVGEDAVVTLQSNELLGTQLVLDVGDIDKPLPGYDTLHAEAAQSITELFQDKALPVVDRLDTTFIQVSEVLNILTDNESGIKAIVADLQVAAEDIKGIIKKNDEAITGVISGIAGVTEGLDVALNDEEKGLVPLIGKLNTVADSLNALELGATLDELNNTVAGLKEVVDKVNEGDGTLARLLNQDSVYQNLDRTLADLDSLIVDLKANPKRYVQFSLIERKEKKED